MDQYGNPISDAIVGIGYIDSTTIELEYLVNTSLIIIWMRNLWIEYDNQNSVLPRLAGWTLEVV